MRNVNLFQKGFAISIRVRPKNDKGNREHASKKAVKTEINLNLL